jgi:hypothetical protein
MFLYSRVYFGDDTYSLEKKFLLLSRPENGALRQVKKTSLSKEDLPIPGGDREGWKDQRYSHVKGSLYIDRR